MEELTRQQEILQAARKEFIQEGIAGARTQAIADNIGVTKAMIHYYFKTKDNLFAEVFREATETLMQDLMNDLEKDTPLFQKIEQFIDRAIERFHNHPQLTGFVMNELNNHPDITQPIFDQTYQYNGSVFSDQLEEAASNYEIAPVKPNQVITNILSLCMFPYGAGSFMQSILDLDEEAYGAFLSQRREVVKDTVINWLAG